jgi:hypothetical protein
VFKIILEKMKFLHAVLALFLVIFACSTLTMAQGRNSPAAGGNNQIPGMNIGEDDDEERILISEDGGKNVIMLKGEKDNWPPFGRKGGAANSQMNAGEGSIGAGTEGGGGGGRRQIIRLDNLREWIKGII